MKVLLMKERKEFETGIHKRKDIREGSRFLRRMRVKEGKVC
jgi:hypothetical protein